MLSAKIGADRLLDHDWRVRKRDGGIRQRNGENLEAKRATPASARPNRVTDHVADENGDDADLEVGDRDDGVIDYGAQNTRDEAVNTGGHERNDPPWCFGGGLSDATAAIA